MATYRIVGHGFDTAAQFTFDAEELRGIASALGPNDVGAQEMLAAASEIDAFLAGEYL